eukprot:TRINITY_DN5851_c0_g1_i1.p1 TRINITY_DN5851_c0_g1~~TRINITY_DN5851_c0_g1_i1.p1  ORF type:complete len:187 (-),score=24.74 TRINITY_DN5851_c0_g1_i1:153-713(-)
MYLTKMFVCLVFPYRGESLLQYVMNRHGDNMPLSDDEFFSIAFQMATAISAIHRSGVIHRDIALRNFLYDDGDIVLIDFGLARFVQSDLKYTVRKPNRKFDWRIWAPEVFKSDALVFSEKTDMWALGMTFLHLVHPSEEPFAEIETQQELAQHLSHKHPRRASRVSVLAKYIDGLCHVNQMIDNGS